MSRYHFDVREFPKLLPAVMRRNMSKLQTLLAVLLFPLRQLYGMFSEYHTDKTYRLNHTGQVYSLEKIIREHCADEGCHITDGEYADETMVPYDGTESLANYQIQVTQGDGDGQVDVMYAGFGHIAQNDFIVHLPKELYGKTDEAGLMAKIDEYKTAGKTYGIVYDDIVVERHTFRWNDPVCVQEEVVTETHNFRWTDPICVQVENQPIQFSWVDPICIQKEYFTTSKQ